MQREETELRQSPQRITHSIIDLRPREARTTVLRTVAARIHSLATSVPSGNASLGEFLGDAARVEVGVLEFVHPKLPFVLLPDGFQLLDAIIQEATRG